ncbi:uncharacterized protein [Atheta coriaria]|uniref:uncharacterized protein n=1 Tax=Dalotia coriaria TaxID=877792 RepID=UPI0031F3A6F6
MKFLLTIACVALYIASINGAALPDDVKAQFLTIKKECLAEFPNLDHEHLKKMKKNEFVEGDEDLKKFVLCFHKKLHVQKDDGSFDVDKIKADFAKYFDGHTYDKDIEECAKDDHHDAAENAWAFFKCIHPKLPEMEE